jgi:RNAse (barnase) inhibitor barstar
MAWKVALILDCESDPSVLIGQMPVWAISTPRRKDAAVKLRNDWDGFWQPEHSLTLVDPSYENDEIESIMSLIPTLEQHHPSMACALILGPPVSEQLQRTMADLGYSSLLENSAVGIEFMRPIDSMQDVPEFNMTAEAWQSADDVYDAFFRAVRAPKWHGRNFDALNDSISTGNINEIEVPYRLIVRNASRATPEARAMVDLFVDAIRRMQANGCPVSMVVHE